MRAAIDIGTNSVRLLVAEEQDGVLRAVAKEVVITRLGQNVDQAGRLSQEAMQRTVDALRGFRELDILQGVTPVVMATSAVRDAENRAEFLERVQAGTGWSVKVLPGSEEAALSFQGAVAVLNASLDGETLGDSVAVLDIGGGSTELYAGHPNGTLQAGGSVQVGAVRMTERFVTRHPIPGSELQSMGEEICARLRPLVNEVLECAPTSLIAVGGTATSVAAIHLGLQEYSADAVTGLTLSIQVVRDLYERLAKLTLEERRNVPGLQVGREDVIVTGTGILLQVMQLLEFDQVMISDGDLLQASLLIFS